MPEYTLLTVLAVVAVLLLELTVLRTGIFRTAQYWISLAIVFFFQTLMDGWLTRLDRPIVRYDPHQMLGLRFPFDIPVEDFGFGWAMVTLAVVLWEDQLRRRRRAKEATS